MVRPPALPPEEKVRIVLSILAGEMTVAEAARRAKVSEQSVGNWKRQCCRGVDRFRDSRCSPQGPGRVLVGSARGRVYTVLYLTVCLRVGQDRTEDPGPGVCRLPDPLG
jgi:transposase